jgi:hypothetical protein
MAKKPWMTSDDLVSAVSRKIMVPLNQGTFSKDDILSFADEEMSISQVPSIMLYNEEYFVTYERIPLQPNVTRYQIPERAIGMKLRDIAYLSDTGSIHEMTRISPDDKSFFQGDLSQFNHSSLAFYLEGNDIIISPRGQNTLTGFLLMNYYLRPNQLVPNERASIVNSFETKVTIDNALISNGDRLSFGGLTFTAVSSSPGTNEFLIDATSVLTAQNLKNSINSTSLDVNADNNGTSVVTISFTDMQLILEPQAGNFQDQINSRLQSNSDGIQISDNLIIVFDDVINTNVYDDGDKIDFLETAGGHKTYSFDVQIQNISGQRIEFILTQVPIKLKVGDYICPQYECIIPQIPSDLHTGLAERTSARLLSAMGDQAGLSMVNQKIGEIESRQGVVLDVRVEGSPQKIGGKHSLLRYNKIWR